MKISRRTMLAGAPAVLAGRTLPARAGPPVLVNDVTGLNPIPVGRLVTPHSSAQIAQLVAGWPGAISIGGGCFSMGGQIGEEDSLHLDMRGLRRLVAFDPARRIVRVQTGMRWRDLQAIIDPHDLSVKIMQSYADFTIGGALSVNCHGRYVGAGPMIHSIRNIAMVLADGRLVEASRADNAELFYAAIGGYGGLGIVTEVELDLAPNVRMERQARRVALSQYPAFFQSEVRGQPDAILHNADIDPEDFSQTMAVTWFRTGKPVTVAERLFPQDDAYLLDKSEVWLLAHLPGAHMLRRALVDPLDYAHRPVVWRNHEASASVAALAPIATADRSCVLQEYFIPVAKFLPFARALESVLRAHQVNALNISVRQSPPDSQTLLSWAREEIFSFVLYYEQKITPQARAQVADWTRQLIEAALTLGGTYYLPYQLHATPAQFHRAYPGAARFFAAKAAFDPRNRFRNKLWDKYYSV